jgi:hypothetical protein
VKNPNKFIRKSLLSLFTTIVPTFDVEVPKSVDPIPATRILLSTQTKTQRNTSKCGHNWQCSILVEIINEQHQGYADRSIVDDIDEQISDMVDLIGSNDITIPPFTVYNTQYLEEHDMTLETPTKTINRLLVRYQFILNGIYPNVPNNAFTYTIPFELA